MNWSIERLESPRMFTVTVNGSFNADQFRQLMDELAVEKGEFYFWPVIIYAEDLDVSNLEHAELMRASEAFVIHDPELISSKVALVTGPDRDISKAQEFKSVTAPRTSAYLSAFPLKEDALAWLLHENVEGRSFA